MIERTEYLEKLKSFRDKDLIKVITGIRRCGKSTLFDIFIDYLLKNGVKKEQIIKVNLENPELELPTHKDLYNYVKEQLPKGKKAYVFLDEVQQVPEFQRAVDGLYLNKDIDLYITGSNAMLLSGELATLLSGRYIEIKMLPLSYKEYLSATEEDTNEYSYRNYTNRSSFPYAVSLETEDETDEYLQNIYNTIIIKDVMQRRNFSDTNTLNMIAKFMFDNIGNLLSVKKIADTMTSDGRKISTHTVGNYLSALTESFIFHKATRYDIRGKQYLQSGEKYYATDVALRYALLGRKNVDAGRILENVVYLELIRRGYKVFVGKNDTKEVDFVAEDKDGILYVQVAYTVRDEKTLARELSALQSIPDHYPKLLLTMDVDPVADFDGVKKINVLDWLIGK